MEFQDVAESIELPDNSGRGRVLFRPRSISEATFVADVAIAQESIHHPRESQLSLMAIPLSRGQLIRLDELLATWLADRTPFEINLAHESWTTFSLTVGPDADYISSEDKPAFRIEIDWCGISATAVLVVDQSCMRLFHEGVSGWLRLGRAG